jgi:hypothetical protein
MNRFSKMLVVVLLVSAACAPLFASQTFSYSQPTRGQANNDWSFITTWNLSTGTTSISPDWYNGYYTHYYNLPYINWVALFMYDDGTSQTRELCWAWCQTYYH